MESRTRVLLLTLAMTVSMSGCAALKWPWFGKNRAAAAEPDTSLEEQDEATESPPRVIEPEVERRKIKVPKIDTENFELGAFYGVLGVEDFGTNPSYGLSATYHITEDFFFEANIGRTKLGLTSFELLNPGADPLNLGNERRLTYYSLSFGYNFLPGEVFIGRNLAMNSTFYVLGGIGSTKFAQEQKFTVNFGAGYKVLPTDWLALHISVQDRVFESDIFGTNKLTNNLEAQLGVTVFF
ncbi:MAG: outer membrane beta-barrel domain-containing protein [Steroidobacteraceae bacterium]